MIMSPPSVPGFLIPFSALYNGIHFPVWVFGRLVAISIFGCVLAINPAASFLEEAERYGVHTRRKQRRQYRRSTLKENYIQVQENSTDIYSALISHKTDAERVAVFVGFCFICGVRCRR
ncbi:hypothetical protein B0H11DRAFT_2015119 [Mycena galericulata]|nr:hypothetical protein B0H11DRAFT_2015119 [Mycena galericulata]